MAIHGTNDVLTVTGSADVLEPGIRRILAPNPSPMTQRGTNTYIVGERRVAVIDPGPALRSHHEAILGALDPGESISHIFVTHSHLDHSPLAAALSETTGAAVHAFGDGSAGRSEIMQALAATGSVGGGEGLDPGFEPHERLADGAAVDGDNWRLTAIWTPGHTGNHLCFAFGDAIFSGDHVMGWASTMISPPDGDMAAYMASVKRLSDRDDRVFHPGHGDPVTEPKARLRWLLDHRRSREASILGHLDRRGQSITELVEDVYGDIPAALMPAAARNVLAHLIDLCERGLAVADPRPSLHARYFRGHREP
ncbi:MAG: MBL fold metallo-hydrolase [Rhodobacter sp.]|nr:MBL fold metallo-hydrolase [Rhodobacter sp.]MCY4168745.1 MBL fold metallo-hydrolase [Rhodobacter sp.]